MVKLINGVFSTLGGTITILAFLGILYASSLGIGTSTQTPTPVEKHEVVSSRYTPTPHPEYTYIVKRGDRLYEILRRMYGCPEDALDDLARYIAGYNEITNPSSIDIGQKINLPCVVSIDDTFYTLIGDVCPTQP